MQRATWAACLLTLAISALSGCSNPPAEPGECERCTAPPPSVCTADNRAVKSSQAPGVCRSGACEYTATETACPNGCENGRCLSCTPSCEGRECGGDGCGGTCGAETCATPPPPTCADATTLRTPEASGTCSAAGTCSYASTDTTCPYGCQGGRCVSCTPSCEGRECGDDGCGGTCGSGTCTTPPPAVCADAATIRTHETSGTCSAAGKCSYASKDVLCPYGCADAACIPGPAEREWAQWPLTNLGSFQQKSPGVVLQTATGLEWQQGVSPAQMTWPAAFSYCSGLALDGGGWRLPTLIELLAIVDYTQSNPTIPPTVFTDLPAVDRLWSASGNVGAPEDAWTVGRRGDSGTSSHWMGIPTNRVRCVRAGSVAAHQGYVLTADTVTDPRTGLVWQRNDDGQRRNWIGAMSDCSGLTLAGGGWRLPTVSELATIVDVRRRAPAIDTAAFPGALNDHYWSSSPDAAYATTGVWEVDFSDGHSHPVLQNPEYQARCVR